MAAFAAVVCEFFPIRQTVTYSSIACETRYLRKWLFTATYVRHCVYFSGVAASSGDSSIMVDGVLGLLAVIHAVM